MKKIRAISFDNAQEINTLVHVLNEYIENNKLYNDPVKKLLSVAIEVQNMFINPYPRARELRKDELKKLRTVSITEINKQISKEMEKK